MKEAEEKVVILDTIRNLGILPEKENDNAGIARCLAPWVAAARVKHKTLILVHHGRKGGGEHGEGISGGHALFAAVDVALEVKRDNVAARRIITAHARLIQPDELLYERARMAYWSPSAIPALSARKRSATVPWPFLRGYG